MSKDFMIILGKETCESRAMTRKDRLFLLLMTSFLPRTSWHQKVVTIKIFWRPQMAFVEDGTTYLLFCIITFYNVFMYSRLFIN